MILGGGGLAPQTTAAARVGFQKRRSLRQIFGGSWRTTKALYPRGLTAPSAKFPRGLPPAPSLIQGPVDHVRAVCHGCVSRAGGPTRLPPSCGRADMPDTAVAHRPDLLCRTVY